MFRSLITCTLLAIAMIGSATAQISSLATHNAMEGQCFTRIVKQEVVETFDVSVEVSPEKVQRIMRPAVYRTEAVEVEIKQATTRIRVIPATYETITERVMISPAREQMVVIPAKYETQSDRVMIEPEKVVWKSGNGLYGRATMQKAVANSEATVLPSGETLTGEVLCRVVEPAKYRVVTKAVLVEPARTVKRQVPAIYKTVSKAVVKTPAQITEEVIPAEFMTIPVKVMVEPERFETQVTPAVFKTVTKERVVPSTEWAEVLCNTNATQAKIAEIQKALSEAGYFTSTDGVFGPKTLAAMEAYQKDKALPVGYMTVETVRSLGVNPYT